MSSREDSTMEAGVESAALQRYGKAAQARQEALCCPTRYNAGHLKALPAEILERDYGCGDPSMFAREGDTVLALDALDAWRRRQAVAGEVDAGALQQEEAGFHGVTLAEWGQDPFAVEQGIEFRAVTVTAHKGHQPGQEGGLTVLYRGPYRQVTDHRGQVFHRGARVVVDADTFAALQSGPYAADFVFPEQPSCGPATVPPADGSPAGCC